MGSLHDRIGRKHDEHSAGRNVDVLAEEAPHLIADEVVLRLTRAEADLLASVLDFGGIDNDNLSHDDRDTCQRIADRLAKGI